MLAGFAYVQARVQARFGALPEEAAWQSLEASRTLSGYLEEARHTGLAAAVAGLSLVSDTHQVERQLRQVLQARLAEAAGWLPPPWREPVIWLGWLPELPLLDRSTLSARAPPALRPAPGAPATLAGRWLVHWRRLWPAMPGNVRNRLEELVSLVAEHQAGFAATPPEQAWEARARLAGVLRRQFRRNPLGPVGLFAWLALEFLALERLRAALVVRAAFPPEGAA
jgi:hypothetical protein